VIPSPPRVPPAIRSRNATAPSATIASAAPAAAGVVEICPNASSVSVVGSAARTRDVRRRAPVDPARFTAFPSSVVGTLHTNGDVVARRDVADEGIAID
jgi:hypothetical protein